MQLLIDRVLSKDVEKEYSPNLMPVQPFSLLSIKKKTTRLFTNCQNGRRCSSNWTCCRPCSRREQGTRLGFQGPKGILPITPVKKEKLFAALQEK